MESDGEYYDDDMVDDDDDGSSLDDGEGDDVDYDDLDDHAEIPFEFDEEPREERGKLNPKHFAAVTTEDLVDDQLRIIEQANEVLQMDNSYIRILLQFANWNVEKLLQVFLEEGQERLFKRAGIDNFAKDTSMSEASADDLVCSICYDDIDPKTACSLSCKHLFCAACWKDYLTLKIAEEGRRLAELTCMAKDCHVQMEDHIVKSILSPELYKKYCSFLLDSYVDNNPFLTFCPAPGCNKIIKVKTPGTNCIGVVCACGHAFCFACKQDAHLPATCNMLKAWKTKGDDQGETTNWLKANTKSCPKCGNPVEKNGGCNHISCSCGAHFCWMCMGLFDTSTVYRHNCNMFDDTTAFQNDEAQNARALIERYNHYVTRYDNHENSKKLESKLLETTQHKAEKLSELDTSNSSWIDQRYLLESTRQLFQCRDILKYAYVFAYYAFDPNYSQGNTKQLLQDFRPFINKEEMLKAKEQFEYHQEELETTTERLSGMLEMTAEKILATKDYRIQVIDLTRLALNKFNAMFGAVDWIKTRGATGQTEKEKKPLNASTSGSSGKGKGRLGKSKGGDASGGGGGGLDSSDGGGGRGRDVELSKSTTDGLMETVEVTKKFWNSAKPLTFKASISSTAYPSNYDMVIELNVQNPGSKKIKAVKVSLEKVETQGKRPPKVTRVGTVINYKDETAAINASPASYDGYLDFKLPPSLDASKEEQLTYRLCIEMEMSGHSNARGVLPVRIRQT
eukprot:TRINITY_DN5837_c0_g2_i1.p1 TRINITY_DN5837_c0_g2~~TRINITY_DN5837_c0_g2_i1.p1  ORF type:complete len:737 (+),score=160.44 TRINITY_DN5837_c0_g2_i1:90-2300(+)